MYMHDNVVIHISQFLNTTSISYSSFLKLQGKVYLQLSDCYKTFIEQQEPGQYVVKVKKYYFQKALFTKVQAEQIILRHNISRKL